MAQIQQFEGKDIIINQTWAGVLGSYCDDNAFRNHIGNGAIFEQDMIRGMLEPYVKRSKYIFDIGAHCGHHTMAYSTFNPEAEIHSFEPQSLMFKMLNINVMNNSERCMNVRTYNLALSNKHTNGEMEKGSNGGGGYIGKGGEPIKMITLDSLNVKGCDYMKIDVEGHEPLVLEGAIETIKKYRPVICFEDVDFLRNRMTEKNSHQILKDLEYVIHPLVYNNFLALPLVKSGFKNESGHVPGVTDIL